MHGSRQNTANQQEKASDAARRSDLLEDGHAAALVRMQYSHKAAPDSLPPHAQQAVAKEQIACCDGPGGFKRSS
eukprot:6095621-Pleurochrysis_carterae.AAC.2